MKIRNIAACGLALALCVSALVGCAGNGGSETSAASTNTGESSTNSSVPSTNTTSTITSKSERDTSTTGVTSSSASGATSGTTDGTSGGGSTAAPTDYFTLAPSSELVVDDLEGVEGLQPYTTLGGLTQAGSADYKLPYLKSDSPDAKKFNDTMAKWALTARMLHNHTPARHEMVFRHRYTTIEYGDYVSILVKQTHQTDSGAVIEAGGAFVYDKKNARFLNFQEILEVGGVADPTEFVADIEDELVNIDLVTDQYPYEDGIGINNLKMANYYTLTFAWALGYQPKGLNPSYYLASDMIKAGYFSEGMGVFMPPVSVFLNAEGELCLMSQSLRIVTQNPGEEMQSAALATEIRTWRYADINPREGGIHDLAYLNACKRVGIENPMDGPAAFVVYLGDKESREPYARTQWVVDLAPGYNKHYIFDVIRSIYSPDEEYYAIIPKNRKTGVVVMNEENGYVGLSTIGSTIVGVQKGQHLGLWYRDQLLQFALRNDGVKMVLDPNLPITDLSEEIPENQTADDEMMEFLRIFSLGRG